MLIYLFFTATFPAPNVSPTNVDMSAGKKSLNMLIILPAISFRYMTISQSSCKYFSFSELIVNGCLTLLKWKALLEVLGQIQILCFQNEKPKEYIPDLIFI